MALSMKVRSVWVKPSCYKENAQKGLNLQWLDATSVRSVSKRKVVSAISLLFLRLSTTVEIDLATISIQQTAHNRQHVFSPRHSAPIKT